MELARVRQDIKPSLFIAAAMKSNLFAAAAPALRTDTTKIESRRSLNK